MRKDAQSKRAKVLVTGRLWLGADGARSIGANLIGLLDGAKQDVTIVAYRLTTAASEFVSSLDAALARGCIVRIIRNLPPQDKRVEEEERLIDRWVRDYSSTLGVYDFRENGPQSDRYELHAKMVVIDRSIAVIGSANFSKNGMIKNHELAVRMEGAEVKSLVAACDQMVSNGLKEGVLIQRR